MGFPPSSGPSVMCRYGLRLVLVAEVDPSLVRPGDDPANGAVELIDCPPSAITAWLCDESGVETSSAAEAAKGLSVDEAWEREAGQVLLREHSLLWNDRVEYRED